MSEELKLQLGDRMPGVLQLAAESMEMTTETFLKKMEEGLIKSKDFLPVFTKALREMAAPGLEKAFKTMNVAMKRMVQNGKLLIDAIFQSGVGELFTQIFNSLTDVFQIMQPIMSLLFGFLSAFIKAVIFPIRLAIALIADLVDMVATGFQNVFGVSLDKAMAKIGNFFGFLTSIFSGIFSFVGKIVSGIGGLIGKVSPTMAVARKFPGASETIKQATTKAGEIAGKIGRSTYTKAGGVGASTSEVIGSEAASRVFVEFTGEGKEYLRQNEREKPRTTMSSNIRG